MATDYGESPPGEPPEAVKVTWPRAVWLIVSGATFRTSWPVAVIVGTTLSLINQGDQLTSGHLDVVTGLRVGANFAIPYVVSSIGYLSAHRAEQRNRAGGP